MNERKRLREKYSDEELAALYSQPYDHTQWPDHVKRIQRSVEFCWDFVRQEQSAADLSCGDGRLLVQFDFLYDRIYGDIHPGWDYQGPIEETIGLLRPVDFFILSETLEHLDDPDDVLRRIRYKTKKLFLSTPLSSWADENPEHYWAWDQKAVNGMLKRAKFHPIRYEAFHFGIGYTHQFWLCT